MGIPLINGDACFKPWVNLRCGSLALQRQQHTGPLFLGGGKHRSFRRIQRIGELLCLIKKVPQIVGLFSSPNEATGTQQGITQGTSHTLLHSNPASSIPRSPPVCEPTVCSGQPPYTKQETQMFLNSLVIVARWLQMVCFELLNRSWNHAEICPESALLSMSHAWSRVLGDAPQHLLL